MNNTTSHTPGYSKFSIDDYELVYGRLTATIAETGNALCQRVLRENASGSHSPGAVFLQKRLIDDASDDLSSMMRSLQAAVFIRAEDNDRAAVLRLRYAIDSQNLGISEIAEAAALELARVLRRPHAA